MHKDWISKNYYYKKGKRPLTRARWVGEQKKKLVFLTPPRIGRRSKDSGKLPEPSGLGQNRLKVSWMYATAHDRRNPFVECTADGAQFAGYSGLRASAILDHQIAVAFADVPMTAIGRTLSGANVPYPCTLHLSSSKMVNIRTLPTVEINSYSQGYLLCLLFVGLLIRIIA